MAMILPEHSIMYEQQQVVNNNYNASMIKAHD